MMKRIVTVWMAALKNLWWKLLLILAAMSAAEIGLYHWSVRDLCLRYPAADYPDYQWWSFHGFAQNGKLHLIFLAAVLILAVLCCLQGCRFSGKNYTLQRLPVAEWQVTVLWGLAHLTCFIILWAVQVVLIFVLWSFYVARFQPAAPGLDLLVSIYRCGLFHAVLPLADVARWVYLLTYLLCMSWLTASFGFFQRRGRFRIGLLVLLGCYFTLTVEMGNAGSNIIFTLICLIVAAIDVFGMWGVYHEAQTD